MNESMTSCWDLTRMFCSPSRTQINMANGSQTCAETPVLLQCYIASYGFLFWFLIKQVWLLYIPASQQHRRECADCSAHRKKTEKKRKLIPNATLWVVGLCALYCSISRDDPVISVLLTGWSLLHLRYIWVGVGALKSIPFLFSPYLSLGGVTKWLNYCWLGL